MQAVILTDRLGTELMPLTERQCVAMLPVADKPVLQYTVEECIEAGIEEIIIVLSKNPREIRDYFSTGEFWNCNIRYAYSQGEELTSDIISRFSSLLKPPFVVMRGDILRSRGLVQSILTSKKLSEGMNTAQSGQNLGVQLIESRPTEEEPCNWPLDPGKELFSDETAIPQSKVWALDSLSNFHDAALYFTSTLNATKSEHSKNTRLVVGQLTYIDPSCEINNSAYVGSYSHIGANVVVTGPNTIEANCYIDDGVRLNNSVVLPNSYVGKGLAVENAIVSGNLLIRVDRRKVISVNDVSLLADIKETVSIRAERLGESLFGVTLFILSLPFWVLAFFAACLFSPLQPLVRNRLIVSTPPNDPKSEFPVVIDSYKFTVPSPFLRDLPLIWQVVTGKLRLFGLRPPSVDSADSPASALPKELSGVWGILGPKQLFLSASATPEEIELVEREFIARTGWAVFFSRLKMAAKSLLTIKAWRPVSPEIVMRGQR